MKNKCGILEHDYGCDCGGIHPIVLNLEKEVEKRKQLEELKYVIEPTNQKKFRKDRNRSNFTPKKKKRKK